MLTMALMCEYKHAAKNIAHAMAVENDHKIELMLTYNLVNVHVRMIKTLKIPSNCCF